ncbi:hypothetical protein KRR39_23260 [Nocardioides panacis]|uniref:Uncharacterized protein n=1 Tax=Nocardioides panacis TaxID=2849501 RepID=A0A975SYD4_9ACTN|nr:hypothetical protein [Nocardioides panacis]QWZ08207.1 hypothetical protein KRR39_23260 [Nocardioides panacis]
MRPPSLPSAYWVLWSVAAAVVVALGGLGLLATTSPGNLVPWVLVGHFAGCGGYWMRVHAPSPVPVPVRRDLLVGAAVGAPLTLLVLVGLVGLGGFGGAVLLAVLLLTSPPVTRLVRSRLAGQHPPVADRPRPDGTPVATPVAAPRRPVTCPPADGMTTAQLCRAWRVSFTALDTTLDRPEERAQVVQRRQEYLDALERRDPRGFARWIGLGPRAASNPGRYLARGTDVEPPAA